MLFRGRREVIELYIAKTRLNVAKVYLYKVYRIYAGARGIRATLRLEIDLGRGALLRGGRA